MSVPKRRSGAASPFWLRWWEHPIYPLQTGVVAAVMLLWAAWTVWLQADWLYQVVFLGLVVANIILVTRPFWFLHLLILMLVGDVSGYISETIQIPAIPGFAGVIGKTKIPELLSACAVIHLMLFFFVHPQEFRRPLVLRCLFFAAAGVVGLVIGLREHIKSEAMRDALGHYFVIFFIMGLVLMADPARLRTTMRFFVGVAFFSIAANTVVAIFTRSTDPFYSQPYALYYAACAYFLLAKYFTTPAGARRWPVALGALIFIMAIMVGRTRSGVFGLLLGLVPLWWVLKPKHKLQVALGTVAPAVAVFIALFIVEQIRGVSVDDPYRDRGARGLEAFLKVGDKEYDPTGSYRLDLWSRAFQGFLESPIFGKGYGWQLHVQRRGPLGEMAPAAVIHNSYLHVLACGGLIAAIPMVIFVGSCLLALWRRWCTARDFPQAVFAACGFGIGINFFFMCAANVGMEIVSPAALGWWLVAVGIHMANARPEDIALWVSARP